MKKRPFMPPSEQANARVFDGTNWYVAANETENNYSGSALQSNLAAAVSANAVNTGTGYTLGAYYYGEWKTPGRANNLQPWSRLQSKGFTERKPILGWFSDDAQYVIDAEINMAYEFGLDFFAFDWYWTTSNTTFNEHTIAKFMASPNKAKMKFCLCIANHTDWPNNFANWQAAVDYWIANYFSDPQYLKVGGKPMVIIFSPDDLRLKSSAMGKTSLDMLTEARNRYTAAGGSGIHFVACAQPHMYWVGAGKYLEANGYNAITAYNYHYKYDGSIGWNWNGQFYERAKSYADKDSGHRAAWDWVIDQSGTTIPYYLPLNSGWDDRPWWATPTTDTLGAENSPYWNCSPSASDFAAHLSAAKQRMDASPTATSKIGIVYAWNEYGEGGYIAPTQKYSYDLLSVIKSTFGK